MEFSKTATDYMMSLKQARAKILRKVKSRDRNEVANKRTELYNLAEKVNSSSPVVKEMTKSNVGQDEYPTHVALVPDGNRRWAEDRELTVGEGYAFGAEKIKRFREWSMVDNNVEVVSAFLMSTENIGRIIPTVRRIH